MLLFIVVTIQIVTIIGLSIKINDDFKMGHLFKDPLFLLMRLVGEISTLCFLITGMIITAQIKNLPRGTEYE